MNSETDSMDRDQRMMEGVLDDHASVGSVEFVHGDGEIPLV